MKISNEYGKFEVWFRKRVQENFDTTRYLVDAFIRIGESPVPYQATTGSNNVNHPRYDLRKRSLTKVLALSLPGDSAKPIRRAIWLALFSKNMKVAPSSKIERENLRLKAENLRLSADRAIPPGPVNHVDRLNRGGV